MADHIAQQMPAALQAPSASTRGTLAKVSKKAVSGGIAGMAAQAINVLSLMWMRTIYTYQYRYGGGLVEVTKKLWVEGGVPRFYRGLMPALILAPTVRFFDTAANDGALLALEHTSLPIAVKTMAGSSSAAGLRVFLMPLDNWLTTKQVGGAEGLRRLVQKAKKQPSALWQGASMTVAATWVGHYLWYTTNNQLSVSLPPFEVAYGKHVRNAAIGFTSAAVTETLCNSLKVLKTNKQTAVASLSYMDSAKEIIAKDGYSGLFGRGLKTSILTNGIQAALFTIGWKALGERLHEG